jgi:hypothetical protein
MWPLLVVLLLLTKVNFAQSDVGALETVLKGKQKALRSYSADPVVRYTWANDTLQLKPVEIHTVGLFTLEEIKLKKSTLILKGKRSTLIRDAAKGDGLFAVSSAPMSIEIDFGKTDTASIFPRLEGLLFFYTLDQAVSSLPENVEDDLPYTVNSTENSKPKCCERFFADGQWKQTAPEDNAKFVPPELVTAVSTEASGFSKQFKKTGVELEYCVTAAGRVGEIWLAKPVGPEMDQASEATLQSMAFRPARYDNRPVGAMVLNEAAIEIR